MTLRNIFILAAWVLAACHVSFETYLSLSLYRHFLSLTQQIYRKRAVRTVLTK